MDGDFVGPYVALPVNGNGSSPVSSSMAMTVIICSAGGGVGSNIIAKGAGFKVSTG